MKASQLLIISIYLLLITRAIELSEPDPGINFDANYALQAYDCRSPTNIRDYSFSIPSACKLDVEVYRSENQTFELMQAEGELRVKGWFCRIFVDQSVSYCGTYDHSTPFQNTADNFKRQRHPISAEQCWKMVKDQRISYSEDLRYPNDAPQPNKHHSSTWDWNIGDYFEDKRHVKAPGIHHISIEPVGLSWAEDGHVHCEGAEWYSPFSGVFIDSAVVIRHFTLEFKEELFTIPADKREFILATSTGFRLSQCEDRDGSCQANDGVYVWDATQLKDWCPLAFNTAFRGITVTDKTNDTTVVMSTDGKLLRFIEGAPSSECGHVVYQTNYKHLFLNRVDQQGRFPETRKVHASQVNIHTFVVNRDDRLFNDLIDYVSSEFNSLLINECYSRTENARSFAWISNGQAELLAYLMGNGTFALAAGETLYYYDCQPVVVFPRLLSSGQCYHDLPVHLPKFNASAVEPYFLERLTRRLTTSGIEVPCNPKFLPKFKDLNGRWISVDDKVMHMSPPADRRPITPYWDPSQTKPRSDYSQGGIYTSQQMTSMQQYLDFGRTQVALQNRLTMQYRADRSAREVTPTSLFPDPDGWQDIASGYILGGFIGFLKTWGEMVSFALTVWFTVKILLWIWQFSYHFTILRPMHGCCWSLLWSISPTTLFMRQQRQDKHYDISILPQPEENLLPKVPTESELQPMRKASVSSDGAYLSNPNRVKFSDDANLDARSVSSLPSYRPSGILK